MVTAQLASIRRAELEHRHARLAPAAPQGSSEDAGPADEPLRANAPACPPSPPPPGDDSDS
eukprot:7640631-Alexandrium_andersonii.AAC.1